MNKIGLKQENSQTLVQELNILLANYQMYYQNLRGFHWNIKGANFFELHLKFEELYNDSQEKIDMIAERILTLGGIPLHSFHQYISLSEIKAAENVTEDRKIIELILESLKTLLIKEREILNLADEADDEGSNSMMSDFISEQEKTVWMFSSWLG
jgi:starvation-inducible DNA-binding protein